MMRAPLFLCAIALTACGDGNATLVDAAPQVLHDSAPPAPLAPTLTSFVATPSFVSGGLATDIKWTWTYAGLPFPDPACTIDNGVGAVTNGKTTSVTLDAITTFTITCTNSVGSRTRQVVVTVPPVAPTLATFVATPANVPISVATNVAWSWTYTAPPPTPAPTCSISPTVGAVTNGQTTSVTQAVGTTYTLTCMNSAGTRTRTVFVTAATVPVIATFTATPSTLTINAPTNVTFNWTYSNTPSPVPTCTIDQGIGAVTMGAVRSVTLAATTVFTLTCTNTGGMAMQPVTITAQ
jgi:hypothetical protein